MWYYSFSDQSKQTGLFGSTGFKETGAFIPRPQLCTVLPAVTHVNAKKCASKCIYIVPVTDKESQSAYKK